MGRSLERAAIGPLDIRAAEKIAIIADRLTSPKAGISQRSVLSKWCARLNSHHFEQSHDSGQAGNASDLPRK